MGLGAKDMTYVVHPDTEQARLDYRKGFTQAYVHMMEEREKLNLAGLAYWNTDFDWMFKRLVEQRNLAFLRKKPYPEHGIFGLFGKLVQKGV